MKRHERTPRSEGRSRHKRRVVNKKRLLLTLFLIAIGAELVFVMLTSPVFAVKKIRVIGNQTISDRQVLRTLKLPKDANIFRVKEDQVLRDVRRDPVVHEAALHRRIPCTLIVSISERQPHFVLSSSGSLYEVDDMGIPFRLDKMATDKLPMISCQIRKKIILGRPIKDSVFDSARKCLLLAQAKKFGRTIKITVDQKSDMCLNIPDDVQVKLGRPEQLARKLDVAEQVMRQSPDFQERGAYIDVTCPEAPAYKLKE